MSQLAANPFSVFVNRSLLIVALAGLWPLLRTLGATSARDIGLVNFSGQSRRWLAGFVLGFVSLAVAAGLIIAFKGRMLNTGAPAGEYVKHFFQAAVSALAVSMLEEILFRGGVFGSLRRVFDWRFALMLSSMIYAIMHFFQSVVWFWPVTWHSGLEMLPRMAAGFIDVHKIFPGFLNLTLVGVILALAYQRTGNLWFSIGLHGGWVFWLKYYNFLTKNMPGVQTWFWGTARLVDSWLVVAILLVTLAVAHNRLLREPEKNERARGLDTKRG